MTIEEFIDAFDENELYAEYDEQGSVYIYDNTYGSMMARLRINSSVWTAEDETLFIMSPSLLRLMAELADTPPEKRKVTPRYVILNGKPERNVWLVFIISDYGWLDCRCVDGPDNLDKLSEFSYTREELDELKVGLSPRLKKAIDAMTVTLNEALKMGEGQ